MSTLTVPGYNTAIWIDVNTDTGINDKPELVLDNNAIKNSLTNLFRCRIGSRRMLREYGTNLHYFLHEPLDDRTASQIRSSLILSIERWEPRIRLALNEFSVVKVDSLPGFQLLVSYIEILTGEFNSLSFTVRRLI